MTKLESISSTEARLVGDVTAATVSALVAPGQQLLQASGGKWQLDMAAVEKVSSVTVALLLEWLRYADKVGISLKVRNVPAELLPIIQISGLDEIFSDVLVAA